MEEKKEIKRNKNERDSQRKGGRDDGRKRRERREGKRLRILGGIYRKYEERK